MTKKKMNSKEEDDETKIINGENPYPHQQSNGNRVSFTGGIINSSGNLVPTSRGRRKSNSSSNSSYNSYNDDDVEMTDVTSNDSNCDDDDEDIIIEQEFIAEEWKYNGFTYLLDTTTNNLYFPSNLEFAGKKLGEFSVDFDAKE